MDKLKELFLHNRMKSLYWRTSMMLAAGFIDVFSQVSAGWDMPDWLVLALGLVLGEVSKHVNKALQEAKQ